MTYREWLEDRFPQHKLYGKEALGREYRRYVGITAGMDPVEYFHMSNDKGFFEWLPYVWKTLKKDGMRATHRNKYLLWDIYKRKPTARLIKFVDEEGNLRKFMNPRLDIPPLKYTPTQWLSEATQTPTEPIEERLERETHPQGTLQEHDPITPRHYGGKDDPYEAIKVINAWGLGFCLGNVLKYIKRAGKKGDPVEDLKKAKRYLELEIEKYESR